MKRFVRSRKFWIMIMVFILIWSGYWITIFSGRINGEMIAVLFTSCIGCTTLFGIAGIGGYVWKDWIRSKHYREGYVNKDGI